MGASLSLPPYGKLPPRALAELVFTKLGAVDGRVLVGPRVGEDAAIVDMGDRVLVAHCDPITGASWNLGWLAINVAANDVASRGARPRWFLLALLLREGAEVGEAEEVMSQVDEACRRLNASVVGGHSEVVMGLPRSIAVATAIGEAPRDRFVTSSGARPGDLLMATKGACIEGAAIMAHELGEAALRELSRGELEYLKSFIWRISVVPEAMAAVEAGGVTAMHDATEGGVLGAVQELAWASRVGARVFEERVAVDPVVKRLCSLLGVDPLRTISSGTLLIAARPSEARRVAEAVRKAGVEAYEIGFLTPPEEGVCLVKEGGEVEELREPVGEELWRALDRFGWAQGQG
ncbi:MAG: AIR synthase family protein [Candidatus Nezhaarchaeota archaeon]|nr:AIR synthase family protein [Candidatus Nezhaarchaeota archaeon]